MAGATGMFLLGLFLLLLGGDSVLRGASGLGQRLGLSPFAAGLLLVAFATSVPELAVAVHAVALGQPDLALGNAIGSNLVNCGLVLGLAALVAPLLGSMRLLATEVVLLLVATGLVLVMGLDGTIARWEGGVLVAGFASFLALAFRRGRDEGADVHQELTAHAVTSTNLVQNLLRLAIAAALLYFGSRLVVENAPTIGLALGMGPMLTGLLLVAIGTALPELVVACMAAAKGQGNVVIGSVLGASLFNLLAIVGGMALFAPLGLPASFIRIELPAAMAFALILYPVFVGDLRVSRREGAILVLAFVAWVAFELVLARA